MDKKEKKRTIFVVLGTFVYIAAAVLAIYFSIDAKAKQEERVFVAEHLVKLEVDNLNYQYQELNIYQLKKDRFIEIVYYDGIEKLLYFADLKNKTNSKETDDYDALFSKFNDIKTNYKKVINYQKEDIDKILGR